MSSSLLELAVDVAVDAGLLLITYAERRRAGDDIGVESKTSATDPVSEADRAAERRIAQRLLEARPDDGLLGEEDQATRRGTSGIRWVVDPLDGTVNFLYHRPTWCVSVAAEDEHGSLVGVVHAPQLGETWVAARDGGAELRRDPKLPGRALQVSDVAELSGCLVATGFAYLPHVRAEQGREVAALLADVRDIRRGGSAALDLAWVADGRVDAYAEAGLHAWDLAAGRLLVTEAGGRVTVGERRIAGERLTHVLAGGAAAHDALGSWLASDRSPLPAVEEDR